MKIILTAVDDDLAEAWARHCFGLPDVSIHQGSILDLEVDAVVSPANSFGFMDGGIDALYSQHFGWHVQDRLQHRIRTAHGGELLIGTAEIVETRRLQIAYVIAAPTMRVPMILRDSVNPYLAARAVLRLIRHGTMPTGDFVGQPIASFVTSVAFRPGDGRRPNRAKHLRATNAYSHRRGSVGSKRFPDDLGGRSAQTSVTVFRSSAQLAERVESDTG